MKQMKFLTLLMVLVFSMGLVMGCSDDDDDNPTGPGDNNGDVTADDMSDAQIEQATQSGMNATAQGSMSAAMSMKGTFNGGGVGGLSVHPEGLKAEASIAEPPANWTGPDGDGWYIANTAEFPQWSMFDEVKLRWNPDRWDDDYDGSPLTMLEYMMNGSMTQGPSTVDLDYDYRAETNADRSLLDGEMNYESTSTTSAGGQQSSYSSGYSATWSDVALAQGDYQGTYTSSIEWPVVGATGVKMAAMGTEITLDSEGVGEGSGTIANEEYVRYYFEGVSNNSLTGYYTMKKDNWETQYPINWGVL